MPDGGSLTASLATRAGQLFPDGRLTAADTRPYPLVLSRAKGALVWDADGAEYLDFHLSSGALIAGHAHPAVEEAQLAQLRAGLNFGAMNAAAIALAERIVERVPGAEQVKFATSGTEANLHAIRMARAATGRDLIIRFEGAYHGHLDMVSLSTKLAGLGARDALRRPDAAPIADSPGIPHAIQDLCLVLPFNDADALRAAFARHGPRVAALLMEPLQRFIPPVPGFLAACRAETQRHGALLIFDEVVTGFRVAQGGMAQLSGITPDLVVMGKIIGAGTPNAAIGGGRALMGTLFGRQARAPVYLAGTFAGQPVAAAGGAAVLDALAGQGAMARLHALGARAAAALERAIRETGLPARIYAQGPMFHIHLSRRAVRDARDALHEDKALRRRVWDGLLRRRVHITGGRGFVSLQHDEAMIDALAARFAEAAHEAMAAAGAGNRA